MIKIHTEEYGDLEVDFDPSKYKTKAGAAKAFHAALTKLATGPFGHAPTELALFTPAQSEEMGYGRFWHVMWEAGPWSWAINTFVEGPWGYCEPYYSFSVQFTD